MNGIKTIVQKELARVFGDKKLIFSLFIMPALLMVILYSLMGTMMNSMVDDIEKHTSAVTVINAPEGFDAFVQASGVNADMSYITASDKNISQIDGGKLKDSIMKGSTDLVIAFDPDFLEQVYGYQTGGAIPEVKTYYNPTEDYSNEARSNLVDGVLTGYKQTLLSERVGDLDSLTVFTVDSSDSEASTIMDESKAGSQMLSMLLPYLIVMLLFTGPMSLGIDAITGEKERGTMASMLVSPVKRSHIVIGKIVSLSVLSCLSAIVYAVSMIISIPKMYGDMEVGGFKVQAHFSAPQMLQLLVIMLALVYLYVAVVILVAVFAKTMKEANTYVSPVYILVIVAGIFTMFAGNAEIELPMYAIPVYGSAAAIQRVITNELTAAQFGVSVLGTLALSVILTILVTKAFNSEKVMFNA